LALTHFFGLCIKSFINLKIASATSGIGGEIVPIASPCLRAWLQSARYVYVSINSNARNMYQHNNWASTNYL